MTVWLRQMKADAPALAVVVVVVALTAALGAAVPQTLDAAFTRATSLVLDDTGMLDRSVAAVGIGLFPAGTPQAPLQPARRALEELHRSAPPVLRERWDDGSWVVSTPKLSVLNPDLQGALRPPTTLTLATAGTLEEPVGAALKVVEGRLPQGDVTETDSIGQQPTGSVEAAVSTATANILDLQIGDTVAISTGTAVLFVPIVGLVTATGDPPTAVRDLPRLLQPAVIADFNLGDIRHAAALVSEQAWNTLARITLAKATVRFDLGSRSVPPEMVGPLAAAVRQVETSAVSFRPTGAGTAMPLSTRPASRLDSVLSEHLLERRSAAAVVALTVAGSLGVAAALLLLTVRLMLERRRRSLYLAVVRGGSPLQLMGVLAVEGMLLGAPVAAAAATAVAALPGRVGTAGMLLAALPVAALVLLLPAVAARQILSPGRVDRAARVLAKRLRVAGESFIAVLAATAIIVLYRQGGQDVDWLTAAAPLLVGVAAALAVGRVYPWPVAAAARAAAARPGLVGFLAAARASRSREAGTGPVLVLLLAVATATTSLVIFDTVQAGTRTSAWREVGADARALGGAVPTREIAEAAARPELAAVTGLAITRGELRSAAGDVSVTVLGVDPDTYAAVRAASPQAGPLSRPLPNLPRSDDHQIGVMAGGPGTPEEPAVMNLVIEARTVQVAVAPAVPGVAVHGVGEDDTWVLAPLDELREKTGRVLPLDQVLAAASPGTPSEAAGEALRAALPSAAVVQTPPDIAARTAADPLQQVVRAAFPLGAASAALGSLLAVLLTFAVTGPARARLLSLLRTLGLAPGQARALAAIELAPLAVAAVIGGLLVGIAAAAVVAPGLALRRLTGGSTNPALTIDPLALVALAAGILLVLLAATLIAVATSRRLALGAVLRIGDD